MNVKNNEGLRVNGRIRISPVVVIDQNGDNLGPIPLQAALGIAAEAGLDLVEIAPSNRPPVCKVMDYGKYKFDQDMKDRKLKKKQSKLSKMKEVRISPSIQEHDLETKAKSAIKFLQSGNKVNVRLEFRRREMAHQDLGSRTIKAFIDRLSEFGKPSSNPRMEGKVLSCMVEPLDGIKKGV